MDKLVIEPLEPKLSKSNLVRLSDEAMQEVQKVQTKTNQTASYIVGKMIAFAMEHLEISPK